MQIKNVLNIQASSHQTLLKIHILAYFEEGWTRYGMCANQALRRLSICVATETIGWIPVHLIILLTIKLCQCYLKFL